MTELPEGAGVPGSGTDDLDWEKSWREIASQLRFYRLSPEDREDLTVEVAHRLLRFVRRQGLPTNLGGLIHVLCNRSVLTHYASGWRESSQFSLDDPESSIQVPDSRPGPSGHLNRSRAAEARFLALEYARAKEPDCLPIFEAYFAEAPLVDLLEVLRISESALYKRHERCREHFVSDLRRRGPGWARIQRAEELLG